MDLRGLAGAVLDVLDGRGFAISDALRGRILAETSADRLRAWHKRAVVAANVDDLLTAIRRTPKSSRDAATGESEAP